MKTHNAMWMGCRFVEGDICLYTDLIERKKQKEVDALPSSNRWCQAMHERKKKTINVSLSLRVLDGEERDNAHHAR